MNQQRLETTLSNLITFKTYEEYPNKNREVLSLYTYVKSQLPQYYRAKVINRNKYSSFIVTPKNNPTPYIILQAHVDVVPAHRAQFNAQKKEGRVYGRGASDMKFAIACFLHILKKRQFNNVGMWLTSDEEIGGFHGVKHILDTISYKPKFCILPDGGDNWNIVESAKGVLHFSLTAQGKSAHGSRPWQGKSAILILINTLMQITNMHAFKPTDKTCHWHNTVNIGKINAGEAVNSVAKNAVAYCDVRFTNNKDIKKIIKKINHITKKNKVAYKEEVYGGAFQLNKKNKYINAFIQVLKHKNISFGFSRDYGSSDARFFAEKNIPVLMCKPICAGHHSNNEWIDTTSLNTYTNVIEELLLTT